MSDRSSGSHSLREKPPSPKTSPGSHHQVGRLDCTAYIASSINLVSHWVTEAETEVQDYIRCRDVVKGCLLLWTVIGSLLLEARLWEGRVGARWVALMGCRSK